MNQDRVLATYLIETPHSLEHAAAVMAGEQSSGTFVSVPGETNELKERFGATVLRIEPLDTVPAPSLPGSKAPRSETGRSEYRRGRVVISFPLHNFGPSLPSLLATVAGNLYELQELSGIRLVDLELPDAFAERYPGPGFGIDGTRRLAQVQGRPLIGTILKPSIGLSKEPLCKLVRDLASAGLDFIKDDELQADPPYLPLAERIVAVMGEVQRVADATGKKAMYAFNITGDVEHMLLRIDGGDLTADLLEALDNPHGRVAVARVVRGGEAGRAGTEDRNVDDVAHAPDASARFCSDAVGGREVLMAPSGAAPLRLL